MKLLFPVAQQHLNGVRIYGKEIRVSKSKHTTVNMPRDEDEVSFQNSFTLYFLNESSLPNPHDF